jgi:DNA-binding NarL/FixJ family response regulator
MKIQHPIRVTLVDDDENIHLALRNTLAAHTETWNLETCLDGAQALDAIPSNPPDVVLMDIRMPGSCGIECVRRLARILPDLPILMHSARADQRAILESLAAGARGYVIKPVSAAQLLNALEKVVGGGCGLCDEAQAALLGWYQRAHSASSSLLSKKERQVMLHLAQGLPDKGIADELNISHHTVHVHLRAIYRKLEVRGRRDAVRKFLER